MSVTAHWLNDEHTVMIWTFEGKWTWTEYYAIRDRINTEINAEPHTVDLIVDMRNSTILPDGLLTHSRTAFSTPPLNIGITVFVGLSKVLRSFYLMVSKVYNSLLTEHELETFVVSTVDEALILLEKTH